MRTQEVISHYGTQKKVADALGMKSQSSVATWGEYPPELRQLQIHRDTNGKLPAEPDVIAKFGEPMLSKRKPSEIRAQ